MALDTSAPLYLAFPSVSPVHKTSHNSLVFKLFALSTQGKVQTSKKCKKKMQEKKVEKRGGGMKEQTN